MSYIKPSVLVYQDLIDNGGVANSTPDLECCIIGPAYNVLNYVPGSTASQIETSVHSSVTTTGTISSGSTSLTVVSTGGLLVGDSLIVVGAGASSGNLVANITNIAGNVVTLDTMASVSVTGAVVTLQGIMTTTSGSQTFTVSSQKVGQVIDPATVTVWLDNVKVNTLNTGVEGFLGSLSNNLLFFPTLVTAPTATVTAASTSFSVNSVNGLAVGDTFTLSGAGAAGALYTGVISTLTGGTITFATPTSTQVTTSAVFTKVIPANLNSSTNTLRAEVGDIAKVTYTNNTGGQEVFSSTINSITTSSGLNGLLETMSLTDSLPSDICKHTTGSALSGNANLTSVGSTSGIAVGTKILVKGAGLNGSDFLTYVLSFVADTSIIMYAAAMTTAPATQIVVYNSTISLAVLKTYSDQLLPAVKPISGGANYDVSNVGTNGQVTIEASPELPFGVVKSGSVYVGYNALRTDLTGSVLSINDINDLEGQLGLPSDQNPLALGCQLALANTTTRVRAIAVATNDLSGYLQALELSQGERLYALTPLTQETDILSAFKQHVVQMSTPENAMWRVALVNTAIPTTQDVGQYSLSYLNSNGNANTVTSVNGSYVLTASNATFQSDGVVPGDMVRYSSSVHEVLGVLSNQQLIIDATAPASSVAYYITRILSKTQQAEALIAASTTFGSNRVWNIQPDIAGVMVNGVIKYLPGYYLACGLAGMVAGFPVQQGFTNIGVAGISDLKNSNFYFSRADLNNIAGAGTCLFVQDTQGAIPYCRHELTTDMTVLEYREMLVVKNWDWLSYFYYDKTKGFIGSWNITTDTLNTVRRTIIASSELIKGQKLPRIGAPLLDYTINSIGQDPYNKDTAIVKLGVKVVYPLNYLDIHIII